MPIFLRSPLLLLMAPFGVYFLFRNLALWQEPHARMGGILVFALMGWMLEPIPVTATSLCLFLGLILGLSEHSPFPLEHAVLSREFLGCLSLPVIWLFLGGFFLAAAMQKTGLDRYLAYRIMKPCGKSPGRLLFGVMLLCAVFSMFLSNTATTAMALAMLAPVFLKLENGDPFRKALLLAIPFAANIGGLGTPIGTPPNAIALSMIPDSRFGSFVGWMSLGVPAVFFGLVILWFLLRFCFPPTKDAYDLLEVQKDRLNRPRLQLLFLCLMTVALWLSSPLHGLPSHVVALIPMAFLTATRVITEKEIRTMSWDILFLVAGGIALGHGMDHTGLAAHLMDSLLPQDLPFVALLGALAILAWLFSNFMSHTAASNLLLPLALVVGTESGQRDPIILAVCFACSLAMMLPISTPPNALAYASGQISSQDIFKTGAVFGLICLGFTLLFFAFGGQV